MWSCGVIMFMLLSNKAPFGGRTDIDIVRNVIFGLYDEKFLKSCSDITLDLISKLLEKDYRLRLNAAKAMKHQFFKQFNIKELLNDIKDESIIRKLINNLKNFKCQSIIQEISISYLVHNYPHFEEAENACKLFNIIDVNGDGRITSEILIHGLSKYLEDEKCKEQMLGIFQNFYRENNYYIGYEDFIRASVNKSIFYREEILKFAFKFFDVNGTGEITHVSISNILKEYFKVKEVKESLKKIKDEFDKEHNGKISYPEFRKLMKSILLKNNSFPLFMLNYLTKTDDEFKIETEQYYPKLSDEYKYIWKTVNLPDAAFSQVIKYYSS